MNVSQAYAVAVGSSFLIVLLLNSPLFLDFMRRAALFGSKHLTHSYVLYRHQLVGPWSRAGILIQLSYLAINIICFTLKYSTDSGSFQAATVSEAGLAAGTLSLINAVALFASPHFSSLADVFGLSITHYKKIHRSAGLMCFLLALIHALIALFTNASFSLALPQHMFAIIGASAFFLILLLCCPPLCKLSYELFLRIHQASAILLVYSMWRHLPADKIFPRFYLYLTVVLFGFTCLLQGSYFIYQILRYGRSRARISQIGGAVQIKITPQTPMPVKSGQYINLWIPSISFWSFTQSHPFVVTSWSEGPQNILELFIEPRTGLTREMMKHVDKDGSHLVLFTGPHGPSLSITEYGEVILVASGFGIAAQLPYLKHLVLGYDPRIVRTRRVHLVWQVNNIVDAISAQPLLNDILNRDNRNDDCYLSISIYVESGDIPKYSFGRRANLYLGKAPLQNIFEIEFYGQV